MKKNAVLIVLGFVLLFVLAWFFADKSVEPYDRESLSSLDHDVLELHARTGDVKHTIVV